MRVAKSFPVTMTKYMAEVTLGDPKIILKDGSDRIFASLDVSIQLPVVPPRRGRVTLSGVPEYRRADKAFYLKDSRIEKLELPGLPAAQAELAKPPVQAVAQSVLSTTPVYRLSERDAIEAVAGRVLTGAAVKHGMLSLTLGLPDD